VGSFRSSTSSSSSISDAAVCGLSAIMGFSSGFMASWLRAFALFDCGGLGCGSFPPMKVAYGLTSYRRTLPVATFR
jgi:hypothetical protein